MWLWIVLGVVAFLIAVTVYDVTQKRHAILRNFPVVGHFRYWLESIGPELRQYIVTNNNEERPFSRDQRRWVYASAKRQNNYFGFGTDNDLETSPNHLIIKQAALALPEPKSNSTYHVPGAKVLGAWRDRPGAFRPKSVINLSAMSFGSLSGQAVEANNRGCKIADALHNTGEGGVSPYHDHGGDLIYQLGTGYFGSREPDGTFSLSRFLDTVGAHQVKAIEIKLSQGAKPGRGGVLPAAKVTAEIARTRGIPEGQDCISPAGHSAFSDADSMLDFVEQLAEATGLPIGIKAAIGETRFYEELAGLMESTGRGIDYLAVDGSEGGTGAAPLVFSDHVALPFKVGFRRVYRLFAEKGLHERILFVGSAKLGFPEDAMLAFGMGCDLIATAREPMLAIGCIQAQRCHTGHCPTGVATQNRWLARGLDPETKALRLANYIVNLRKELLWLSHACGVPHPSLVKLDRFEILDDRFGSITARELFKYEPGMGLPSEEDRREIRRIMGEMPNKENVPVG